MVSVAAKASLRKEMKVVLKGLSKETRSFLLILNVLYCFPGMFSLCGWGVIIGQKSMKNGIGQQ